TNFAAFIDKIYEVKDQDKYNEVVAQLALFNAQFYQDFPYFTPKNKWVTFFDLPEELRVNYEVIDIRHLTGKKSLIIGYNDNLGLIGFHVPVKVEVSGVPENYSIELSRKAKVKVVKPPETARENYLIRAIIRLDSHDAISLNRVVPRFFQEVQV
ncbi:MAG TPA: hypothetical protein VKK79_18575, partial [Candidatus Lokiarchaeia archaeon]|nr:hypothetical protein [Candidatus Lokiarchaeia archaeon]